jgi:hypothetical protein
VETIGPGGAITPALPSGLDILFEDFAVNPVENLPPAERWTFYFRQCAEGDLPADEQHTQLDYLLLLPLDPNQTDRSIGYLATRGDRYPRVGWDRPKASDHCPLVVEIEIPNTNRPDHPA